MDISYQFKRMLSIKELESLMELLNKKQETLELVEEVFLSKFKDNQAVFRASYTLSNLLILNVHLLTSQQRIPAIFLLIENYKTEGIIRHPFGATIFQLIYTSVESFEKKMIADIIIDHKREQYSKFPVQILHDKEQAMIDPFQERPEIKVLQEQFLSNLPDISQQGKSQVNNVVRDFTDKQKQMELPEFHSNISTIKESEISCESFNVGFMRPIPKFIGIQASEYNWFGPSLNQETIWDSSAQMSRRLKKGKALMRKAMDQHMSKDQCTEIQRTLNCEPNSVLYMELSHEMLGPLIKQNPFIAVTYLVKLSNYPIFETYLNSFLDLDVSLNLIQVVNRITKAVKVRREFMYEFMENIMVKVLEIEDENKDKQKLAKFVINLLKSLKKSKKINLQEIKDVLDKFLKEFIGVEEVLQFQKSMENE